MNRDGACKSLWQETEIYLPKNPWDKNKTYDVLIVGGGITGVTTALLLQERGLSCLLAEAHNVAFGTTGGTTAHLNTILDTPYYQVAKDFDEDTARQLSRGTEEAIALVETLAAKYKIDCDFTRKTGYLFAEDEQQEKELEKIKEGNDKAGIQSEWTDTIPIPIPFRKAIKISGQAQMHPARYISGLTHALEQHGGVVLQHCVVNKITEDDIITAETCLGVIRAKACVYATHIPPGINIFSFRCAPYRSYAMAFTLKNGSYPDGLTYDCQEPYHYFRTHTINGQNYIIGGGFDHKTGHNENTEYVFTQLEAYLRKHFDVDTVAYRWSSQYFEPADGLPYIGAMPGNENVYVATGYSGNGMTLGSLAAKTLCSIITKESTPYEDLFDPGRIKVLAGFSNFVKENADVVGQFIGKRFSYEKIKELAELAPGEAAVAKWENDKVALYKDERGHIYVLNAGCPHAQCIVSWNSAEKTWDCPCHGSRFAPNGDLLTGPALRGLEQIKPEDLEGD